MKILLHACCAPCLIGTSLAVADYSERTGEKIDFDCFFFNPNIHPEEEYLRRLDALKIYCEKKEITLFTGDYSPDLFFDAVKKEPAFPARCGDCYALRLRRTAAFAAANGYSCFSSTLLVSPFQSRERIIAAGERAAADQKIDFFAHDYSPFFREGQKLAKEAGIYRQKYCGCLFSKEYK